MAREETQKTIDGEEYTFYKMKATTSLRLLTRLFKIVGAPAGAAINGISTDDIKGVLDKEINIGDMVTSLCDRLDEYIVEQTNLDILSQTVHKGSGRVKDKFDDHFKGRIGHMFKVVTAALQAEYSDFFGEGIGIQNLLNLSK